MGEIRQGRRAFVQGPAAATVEAMKGQAWVSPRDVIQNVYLRRCTLVGGTLWNEEFATIPNVKDPGV
jgi:branched-chain amino acid transport system substrate-binding protein